MKINMKVNKIRINKMNKVKSLCFLSVNQADSSFENLIKNKKENGKKKVVQLKIESDKPEVANIREIIETITRNLTSILFSFPELFTRAY